MKFFIIYFVVMLVSFFVFVPFLKGRTKYFDFTYDPNSDGLLLSVCWPFWLLYYLLCFGVGKPIAWFFNACIYKPSVSIFNFFEKLFAPKNKAKEGYAIRRRYDDEYDYDPDDEY